MIPRSASNAAWLVSGSKLDRYELLLPIAEGGMAMLWLARQQGKHGFDRLVAIKTILPKLAAEPGFRQMFLDEARVASRIEHVHVAQVLDLGEENGVLFMAMEWVDSESLINLGRAVARSKAESMPLGILARIMADTCAGLHAAHELKDDEGRPLNVVHRDISPHNLLISYRGITKVIDFGIAKARNRLAHDTNVGTVKGKIAYMAPEQAMGLEVDRRADVWGAGATLYRYLAGRAPYSAANPVATLRLLTSGQPPPPLPPGVSKPMRAVVDKAIELEPSKRFATMEEMRLALEDLLRESEARTSHADVEAFVASHLGSTRSERETEIAKAVRESRSRTRQTMKRAPSPAELSQSARTERPPAGQRPASDSALTVRPPPEAAPPLPEEALATDRPPPVEEAPRRAPPALVSALQDAPTRPSPHRGMPAVRSAEEDDFDRRKTKRMRPKVAEGLDSGELPQISVRMKPSEFPAVRQPLLTPSSMQVAPLSLRTSAPAAVDSDRPSAPRLMRPPTPAWIRIQPQLASNRALPVDAASTPPPPSSATGELTTSDFHVSGFTPVPLPPQVQLPPPLVTRGLLAQGVLAMVFVAGVFVWLRAASAPPPADARAAASKPPASVAVTAALAGADPTGQALEAERQGRLDDALRLFNAAVAQNPSSAPALAGLASVEQARGATADAIADFRRALAADATSLTARMGLADLLWDNGQREEARRLYQSIVTGAPAGAYPDHVKSRANDAAPR